MIISLYVLVKMIKRKETIHILFSTISNNKSARTSKWRRVVLSRKPLYSGISKHIFQFPYSFHTPYAMLSTVYFHTVLSIFSFLFYWLHLKIVAFPSSNSSLFRKSSTIGQLNVQVAAAKNEERCILSNILQIAFQNCYSF